MFGSRGVQHDLVTEVGNRRDLLVLERMLSFQCNNLRFSARLTLRMNICMLILY